MRCSQKICNEVASYTWVHPGQERRSYGCTQHMVAATHIANAGGYRLGDFRVCTLDEMCSDEPQGENAR